MTITADMAWQTLLYIAAGITAIIGAGSMLLKLFNPYRQILKRLDRHDKLFENDNARLIREEACTTAILEALYALLEHARTNNSSGLMDKASLELQKFLINRK